MRTGILVTFSAVLLALSCSSPIVAAQSNTDSMAECQKCIVDAVHSIPSCDGVDNSKNEVDFNDYSAKEQQCLCNLGTQGNKLTACNNKCGESLVSTAVELYKVMYDTNCKGTKFADGGSSGNSGSHISPSTVASLAGAAAIISTIATIVV